MFFLSLRIGLIGFLIILSAYGMDDLRESTPIRPHLSAEGLQLLELGKSEIEEKAESCKKVSYFSLGFFLVGISAKLRNVHWNKTTLFFAAISVASYFYARYLFKNKSFLAKEEVYKLILRQSLTLQKSYFIQH